MKTLLLFLIPVAGLAADPSTLDTKLHFNKSYDGVEAASDEQFGAGEMYPVLAMTVPVATFLASRKDKGFACTVSAMMQHGQWTVFGLGPDCK